MHLKRSLSFYSGRIPLWSKGGTVGVAGIVPRIMRWCSRERRIPELNEVAGTATSCLKSADAEWEWGKGSKWEPREEKIEFSPITIMWERSGSEARCCAFGLELTTRDWQRLHQCLTHSIPHVYFLSWAPTDRMNNAVLIWWPALSCWTPLDIFWLSLASRSFYSEVYVCTTAVYLCSNSRQILTPHHRAL